MRLGCVLMLLWAGCSDGIAPPAFVQDQGVPDEGETDGGDLSMNAPVDLLRVDLLPKPCITACDCTPGERCKSGFCELETVPVFCCGTPACTGSNVCETSSGKVSQCADPDGGVRPDMGAGAACSSFACIPGIGGTAFCTVVCGQAGATCSGTTNHCTP
jgi:hypothetical protein